MTNHGYGKALMADMDRHSENLTVIGAKPYTPPEETEPSFTCPRCGKRIMGEYRYRTVDSLMSMTEYYGAISAEPTFCNDCWESYYKWMEEKE